MPDNVTHEEESGLDFLYYFFWGGEDDFAPLKIKIIHKNAQLPCSPPPPPQLKILQVFKT